jgi:hypothetical protein
VKINYRYFCIVSRRKGQLTRPNHRMGDNMRNLGKVAFGSVDLFRIHSYLGISDYSDESVRYLRGDFSIRNLFFCIH